MKYTVYIDGFLIRDTPKDIKKIKSIFRRDNELKGIVIETVVNLIFVGDGYCRLKTYQEDLAKCEFTIDIYSQCNNNDPELLFSGVFETFKIQINESLKQATLEIEGNSALEKLLKNKSVDYIPSTTISLTDETISAVSPDTIDLFVADGTFPGSEYSGIEVFNSIELLQGLLDYILGNELTVASDYFNLQYLLDDLYHVWELNYAVAPTNADTTTITYRSFSNPTVADITVTVVGNGTAASHIENVWKSLLRTGIGTVTVDYFTQQARSNPQIYFDYGEDNGTNQVIVKTYLPFLITDVTSTSGAVTFEKTQTGINSGIKSYLLNGEMLKKEGTDTFITSFEYIISYLNKVHNIQFVIQGGTFRIEPESYFITDSVVLTLDNVKDLIIGGLAENLYNKFDYGDNGTVTSLPIRDFNFISSFCGLDREFNGVLEGTASFSQIWDDVANPDNINDTEIYYLQGNGSIGSNDWADFPYMLYYPIGDQVDEYYAGNLFLYNYKALGNHFNKFFSDIREGGRTIVNTDPALNLHIFTFKTFINKEKYQSLINNNLSNIKFKTTTSDYYIGIAQEVEYEYETGEASFTVFGRKFTA